MGVPRYQRIPGPLHIVVEDGPKDRVADDKSKDRSADVKSRKAPEGIVKQSALVQDVDKAGNIFNRAEQRLQQSEDDRLQRVCD